MFPRFLSFWLLHLINSDDDIRTNWFRHDLWFHDVKQPRRNWNATNWRDDVDRNPPKAVLSQLKELTSLTWTGSVVPLLVICRWKLFEDVLMLSDDWCWMVVVVVVCSCPSSWWKMLVERRKLLATLISFFFLLAATTATGGFFFFAFGGFFVLEFWPTGSLASSSDSLLDMSRAVAGGLTRRGMSGHCCELAAKMAVALRLAIRLLGITKAAKSTVGTSIDWRCFLFGCCWTDEGRLLVRLDDFLVAARWSVWLDSLLELLSSSLDELLLLLLLDLRVLWATGCCRTCWLS